MVVTERYGIGLTLGGTVVGDPVKVKRGAEDPSCDWLTDAILNLGNHQNRLREWNQHV